VYELTSAEHAPRAASATFHGRDLFAPVAASLAGGGEPDRLGPAVADPVRLDWRDAVRDGDTLTGEVLAVDTFGNLVTSIRLEVLGGRAPARVEVLGRRARVVRTFGDGGPGELVALVGSSGRLEIAVREGSALRALGVGRGAPVVAWIADSR
jgi:S-adenosylmethionine hydrolase